MFLPVSTRLLAGWWMHIHKSAVRPPRALARVPWWGWDVGVRASAHRSNLNPKFDQASTCWVKFSVKSFSRKFSWNWFHGKNCIFRNFRILNLKQVQCFYLLFLPKTTGTADSSTILSTSQISSEVEVNPSQWALPGGSLNKRTESSTKKIS